MNRSMWCILGVCVAVSTAPAFSDGMRLSGGIDCDTSDTTPVSCTPRILGTPCDKMHDVCITDHGNCDGMCATSQEFDSGCKADSEFCNGGPNQFKNTEYPGGCSPVDKGC